METAERIKAGRFSETLSVITQNDLPQSIRENMVKLLKANLADAIDLQLQSKHAHWNVRGPQFFQLHKLFDKVHAAVSEYVDLIAERAAQLGGTPIGTARNVADKSRLGDYPIAILKGDDHVRALSSALSAFGKSAREAISEASEVGDADTADIFTEISRGTDHWLWFVEAHLQAR